MLFIARYRLLFRYNEAFIGHIRYFVKYEYHTLVEKIVELNHFVISYCTQNHWNGNRSY